MSFAVSVASAVVAAVVLALGGTTGGIALGAALGVVTGAAAVDHVSGHVPDRLLGLGAVAIVASILLGAPTGSLLAGSAIGALPVGLLHLASPAAMGFGDVKLMVVLGAIVGAADPFLSLLTLCVASGAASVWAVAHRRPSVAFGPFLVGAGLSMLIAHAALTGVSS